MSLSLMNTKWTESTVNYSTLGSPDNLITRTDSMSSSVSSTASQYFFTGNPSDSEDDDDDDDGKPNDWSGVLSTSISILSNVVGGGILAMSKSFYDSGILLGTFISIAAALLCSITAFMLVYSAEETRLYTVAQLWHFSFPGKKVTWLISIFIMLQSFLSCVVYLIIVRDSMGPVAVNWFHWHGFYADGSFWVIIICPVLFALCSMRRLKELSWTSLIAFLTILYAAVVFYIRFAGLSKNDLPVTHLVRWNFSSLQTIPTAMFAFMLQMNIPPLYKELSSRTPKKMNLSIAVAMVIVTCLTISVAIVGYATWGIHIIENGGDLLAQYDANDNLINIGRFLMLFHFTFVFPLQAHTCRRVFNIVVFSTESGLSQLVLCIEAVILVVSAGLIAIFTPGISVIVALNGSLLGMNQVLTIPGLVYLRVFPTLRPFHRYFVYFIISLGPILTILSTAITVRQEFF